MLDIYKQVGKTNKEIMKGFRSNNGGVLEWVKLITFALAWFILVVGLVVLPPWCATTLLESATVNFLAVFHLQAIAAFPFWTIFWVLAVLIYFTEVWWFGFIIAAWGISAILKAILL